MKAWFNNLAPRERWIVIGGAVSLMIICFWFLVWSPLHNGVNTLTAQVSQLQTDAQWMQAAQQQLSQLDLTASNNAGAGNNRSLLALLDTQINQASLKSALQRMEPESRNVAKVWLQKASFNALITMIGELEENAGVAVTAMTLTPTDQPGYVDARLTFARGNK